MKLRPYHTIIIFAILVTAAAFSSVSSYRRAQYAIIQDMDNALALTLQENQHQWITPDTIQSYRSHLSIDLLKQTSNLCYVVEEDKRKGKLASSSDSYQTTNSTNQLSSREMQLHQYMIQGYANCSMLDIFSMSNQRMPLSLSLMAMLWGMWSLYYYRRKRPESSLVYGSLAYSEEEDAFFNQESNERIKFTPMQHQLMQLFMQSAHHQLSKQEICETLWPKKPDASETLYTLIRRIKPIIEQNSNLMIESERGKAYRLRKSR